ncbi:MAG: glucosaminidase domain-containing protein [Pseudomonadales bacterium]|nr:glucosaminidase domain-containing protein [Pseudomonadales bacterium]
MDKIDRPPRNRHSNMQMILLVWLIVLPATTLAGATLAKHSELDTARPDFAAIRDVQTKKSAFFDYLMPFVQDANAAIEAERARLLQMEAINATGRALSSAQQADLLRLAKQYRVPTAQYNRPTDKLIAQVLQRVDVVPASLILAQAANESGWGTSRFARQANNYFGMWCYQAGCGLKPRQRDAGRSHEVKRFQHTRDSVVAYLHNLNTNRAYQSLRDLRQTTRELGAPLRGVLLAEGLLAYSSRGADYIKDIQAMIITNDLEQLSFDVASQ